MLFLLSEFNRYSLFLKEWTRNGVELFYNLIASWEEFLISHKIDRMIVNSPAKFFVQVFDASKPLLMLIDKRHDT